MKIGFLSVEKQNIDIRAIKAAMFDNGHTAELFVVADGAELEGALKFMREKCEVIVIDGNTDVFFEALKDEQPRRVEYFELYDRLHYVCDCATTGFIADRLLPEINKRLKKRYAAMLFKTYGKTVGELKVILKEFLNKKSKVQFAFFEDLSECEVHARCATNISKDDMNALSDRLYELLHGCSYAYENISIAERVAQILKAEKLKIKIAESFTGGALATAFTALPGASEYLVEDIVAYSVASKNKRLGVPFEVIAANGAVSGDTAYGMALGLMAGGDCDIAIATTGNAGPSTQNGALGLCYVALGITSQKSIAVVKYAFDGDREHNIKCGVKNALFLLYESLVSYRIQKKQRQAQEKAQVEAAQPPVQSSAQQYMPPQSVRQYPTQSPPQQSSAPQSSVRQPTAQSGVASAFPLWASIIPPDDV